MRRIIFLMPTLLCSMEQNSLVPAGHELVIQKIDAIRDRPWHKQIQFWKPNEEYKEAKLAVNNYIKHLDHLSQERDDVTMERKNNLDVLIQAAHQVRIDEEKKSHKLSSGSKVKIGVGSSMIGLSLIQMGVSIFSIGTDQCQPMYKTFSDITVSLGGCLSGAMLMYSGIKNGDGKADASRAAHLHLLLLEKFQEINNK